MKSTDLPSIKALEHLIKRQETVTEERALPLYWELPPTGKEKRIRAIVRRMMTAATKHDALMAEFESAPESERGGITHDLREEKQQLIFNYGMARVLKRRAPDEYQRLLVENGLTEDDIKGIKRRIFAMPDKKSK